VSSSSTAAAHATAPRRTAARVQKATGKKVCAASAVTAGTAHGGESSEEFLSLDGTDELKKF
jgi:hypothetical protein